MKLLLLTDALLTKMNLYGNPHGNPTYSVNDNKLILDASIKYISETKRFDGPIF